MRTYSDKVRPRCWFTSETSANFSRGHCAVQTLQAANKPWSLLLLLLHLSSKKKKMNPVVWWYLKVLSKHPSLFKIKGLHSNYSYSWVFDIHTAQWLTGAVEEQLLLTSYVSVGNNVVWWWKEAQKEKTAEPSDLWQPLPEAWKL